MAHFAKLGINGKVMAVHVVNNKDILNGNKKEDESIGQQFLERLHGWPASMWIQTSYNTLCGKHSSGDDSKALRGNYAGLRMIYDEDNDIFRDKQPYASWILNTTTATWHSPIGDAPDDLTDEERAARTTYEWNEDGKSWDKVVI